MAQVTVTTRVTSESATGVVMVFTQADGSAAQAIVPVSAAGVPAAFVNAPNPAYTGTAVQVAVGGVNSDASIPGAIGAFYGINQLGLVNDSPPSLTQTQVGAVRITAQRGLHVAPRDSTGSDITDTTNKALRVNIVAGGGTGGTAMTDSSAFTVLSTSFTPVGGVYNDSLSPVASGSGVSVRLTQQRAMHTNLRSSTGSEITSTAQGWLMVSNQTLQDVEGPTSQGVAVSTKPLLGGGYGSAGPITAVTAGQHQYQWVDLNGRTRIGANVSSVYGNVTQPITCTLANLNAGTAVSRASAAIDNTVNNFLDALVTININGGRPGGNSQAILYAYGSVNGGTNYTERVSGSDAAYAMDTPTNLRFLGAVPMPYNSQVYTGGPFSVAAAFDGVLPPRWGIVVLNDGAFPFMATNSSAVYVGVVRGLG